MKPIKNLDTKMGDVFSIIHRFFVRKNGWEFVFGVDFCPKILKQKKFMNQ
jgi:hypothetical protein